MAFMYLLWDSQLNRVALTVGALGRENPTWPVCDACVLPTQLPSPAQAFLFPGLCPSYQNNVWQVALVWYIYAE